nr:immunoglobulin heavy chain junction region [Macaca mulatta]
CASSGIEVVAYSIDYC